MNKFDTDQPELALPQQDNYQTRKNPNKKKHNEGDGVRIVKTSGFLDKHNQKSILSFINLNIC